MTVVNAGEVWYNIARKRTEERQIRAFGMSVTLAFDPGGGAWNRGSQISRSAGGTCELAESTRSPPAMIQNWPASSPLAISAVSPKCRSVGSRRTFVRSSLIACRNILGKSCSSLSLSMLTGRIVSLDNCVCRSSRFSPRLANVVVGGRTDKIGCRSIKRCGG